MPQSASASSLNMEPETFNFSVALNLLKEGKKVTRVGWNGSGMFAVYSPGMTDMPTENLFSNGLKSFFEAKGDKHVTIRPSLMLKTAQEDIAYWSPSNSDILASDWFEVA